MKKQIHLWCSSFSFSKKQILGIIKEYCKVAKVFLQEKQIYTDTALRIPITYSHTRLPHYTIVSVGSVNWILLKNRVYKPY